MSDLDNAAILLIDTDQLFVGSVAAILRTAHYTVEIAACGREALTAMELRHADLVMLDITLPDIPSAAFCHIVRQRFGSVPIILLTMQEAPQDAIAALDAGADNCIHKSCDTRELLARIRAILRRVPTSRSSR